MAEMIDDLAKTILPLDMFREIIGIDPYHFWQMDHPDHGADTCGECYLHYRWIGNRSPSRFDYIDAIIDAEDKYSTWLRYWPGEKYTLQEEARLVQPRNFSYQSTTRPYALFTEWRHVRHVGTQTYTSLEEDASPSYDATDDVTITVTGLSSDVQECEVVVCYPDTHVEIRPIDVSISSGTATITIKKWLMGDPSNWTSSDCIEISTTAPYGTNLLDAVDVYRKWIDPSSQIILAWEPNISACGCLESGCQVCALATVTACAIRKNYKEGAVGWQFATWDDDEDDYVASSPACDYSYRYPDIGYISYVHGARNDGCYMSNAWARNVTILAIANMHTEPCECEDVLNFIRYWQEHLGKNTEVRTYSLGSTDLENPAFLHNRGQLYAWRVVKGKLGE